MSGPASTSVSTRSMAPRSRVIHSCAVPSSPPAAPPSRRRGRGRTSALTARRITAPRWSGRRRGRSPGRARHGVPMHARPACVVNRFPSAVEGAVVARVRLPASLTDCDDVAVGREALELERRRAAGRAEGGVVPEDDVTVLERHLVGPDGRRDAVHLEHPAGRACGGVFADLADVRAEVGRGRAVVELAGRAGQDREPEGRCQP